MDRIDAMQVLLAVVDEGSLSAGSRKLQTPLPSVSRKVADLERRLGARLLIRTSRKVQLTDAGRGYVDAARQIVEEIKRAEQIASGEYEVPRGELTITGSMQLGQSVVAPLACEFLEEHPEITLNLLLLDRHVNLADERVDVGVRVGTLKDSSLYAIKVGEVFVSTCASPKYLELNGRPSRPEDLNDHHGVLFGQVNEAPWPYLLDDAKSYGLPHSRIRANSSKAAIAAAVQGLGIIRTLDLVVEEELRSGALVRILENYDGGWFPVHLVYVRQGLLPLKVRAFLDWMTPRLRRRLKGAENSPSEKLH